MNFRKPTLLFLLFSSLFGTLYFSSCQKDEIETIPLETVNGSILETVDYGTKVIFMDFRTDLETYPVTYLIRSETSVNGDQINVNLLDIEKDNYDDLNIAKGPASCRINFGTLSSGQYNLQIKVGTRINNGFLHISDGQITLNFSVTDGFTPNYDSLNRIPFGTVWGYVGYQKTSNAYLATEFINTLVTLGGEPANLAAGNYGYFTISDSGNFVQPINENYAFYKEFLKNYVGSADALNEHIGYYNTEHYNKVDVIINWFYDGSK